jgi:hypothetical protein
MPIDSRIVESRTPIFLAYVSRNAGVGHACGQAGKRLSAAQAHCRLDDLQRVQEFEGGGLAADNVERERGACRSRAEVEGIRSAAAAAPGVRADVAWSGHLFLASSC